MTPEDPDAELEDESLRGGAARGLSGMKELPSVGGLGGGGGEDGEQEQA